MNSNVRSCIAYAAWCSISGKEASGIFDSSQSKRISMKGSVTPEHLDISDQEHRCHLSGNGTGSRFSLYEESDRHHITLNIKGDCFFGHDFGSSGACQAF
jgi:hypothetical protein